MWCRRRHQAALAGNQPVKIPPQNNNNNKHNSIYYILYVYLCGVSTGIFLGGVGEKFSFIIIIYFEIANGGRLCHAVHRPLSPL